VGTLGLVLEPSGTAIEGLVAANADRLVIGLDPNVRAALIEDLDGYRARIERLVAHADLVKVSDDDLVVLYPDREPAAVAEEWFGRGPALVALTRGGDGVTGYTAQGVLQVASRPVEVVDTIGAGDSFNAGLLGALHDAGMLTKAALGHLSRDEWYAALSYAAAVAAITCSRAGADPPWRWELGR
jgi:fructokinase